jgi:hypothetical protein
MPKKKTETLEYRLFITPQFNEREQRFTTVFVLQTTKSFSSFQYEISVEEHIDGRNIHLKILGLKTPQLSLPAFGHALFTREYDNLRGTYAVHVEGLDGTVNVFSVRITQKKIAVIKAPPKRFVDVIVDQPVTASE